MKKNLTALRKASMLLAIASPLQFAAAQASAVVLWEPGMISPDDSNSVECIKKSSGAWHGCKAFPRGETKLHLQAEVPTPTKNAYITAMAFQNIITYTYDCGGAYNDTRLIVGDWTQNILYTPTGFLKFIFPTSEMGKYEFQRDSKGFSTISSTCKLDIVGNDSYPVSLDGLKLYANLQVEALNAYTEVIKTITKTGDVSVVVDSINTAIGIFEEQITHLQSEIDDIQLDIDLASTPDEKTKLLLTKAGFDADYITRNAALEELKTSAEKVQITCVDAECATSLTAVVDLVKKNSRVYTIELKEQILPWLIAENDRLKVKNAGIAKVLETLHGALVKKIKPAPEAVAVTPATASPETPAAPVAN